MYLSAQHQQTQGMPVTSAVTVPYNGTSNQTQIAKTHSIPDADPSMLSNTRTNNVRHTKYTTPALDKLTELPSISVLLLTRSLIPYPYPNDFHVAVL